MNQLWGWSREVGLLAYGRSRSWCSVFVGLLWAASKDTACTFIHSIVIASTLSRESLWRLSDSCKLRTATTVFTDYVEPDRFFLTIDRAAAERLQTAKLGLYIEDARPVNRLIANGRFSHTYDAILSILCIPLKISTRKWYFFVKYS